MNSVLMETVYQFNFLASWDDGDILDIHLKGIQFWVSAAMLNSVFHEYSVSRKLQALVLLGCKSHLNPFILVTQWVEMVEPWHSATVCSLQFVAMYRWRWIEMLCNGKFPVCFFSHLQLYALVSYVYMLIGVGTCVWTVVLKEALVKL